MTDNTQGLDEILYDFAYFYVIEANPLMDMKGWSIDKRNAYINEHKENAMQKILQWISDEVIDAGYIKMNDLTPDAYEAQDRIIAAQRAKLKEVMGGE